MLSLQQPALRLAGTVVIPGNSAIPSIQGHPGGTLPEGVRTAARLKAARSRAGAVAGAQGHSVVKSRVCALFVSNSLRDQNHWSMTLSSTLPVPYKALLGDFSQTCLGSEAGLLPSWSRSRAQQPRVPLQIWPLPGCEPGNQLPVLVGDRLPHDVKAAKAEPACPHGHWEMSRQERATSWPSVAHTIPGTD